MKKLLSLAVYCLALCTAVQCGDDELKNPHYPIEPSIKFKSIKFIELGGIHSWDSLRFTISYRDGDSDLGLSSEDPNDIRYPYHEYFLFLGDGTGDTTSFVPDMLPYTYPAPGITSAPHDGLIVTSSTRERPNYGYLPEYNESSCLNYYFGKFLARKDLNVVDNSFDIEDTVQINGNDFIVINEQLLYKQNENYHNLFIEFYKSEDGVNFTKFDWLEEYCINYNARFPLIANKRGGTVKSGLIKMKIKTPWEGQLTYSMVGSSFAATFGDQFLKLKITIKDRALHTSNTLETPVFKLADIK